MVSRVSSIRPFSSDIIVRPTAPGMILSDGDIIRFINQPGLKLLGAPSAAVVIGRSLAGFFAEGAPEGWAEAVKPARHAWRGVDGRVLDVTLAVTHLAGKPDELVIEIHDA